MLFVLQLISIETLEVIALVRLLLALHDKTELRSFLVNLFIIKSLWTVLLEEPII
jgi:hypothetical protein